MAKQLTEKEMKRAVELAREVVSVANERLGPAGYKIVEEVAQLRAERARQAIAKRIKGKL